VGDLTIERVDVNADSIERYRRALAIAARLHAASWRAIPQIDRQPLGGGQGDDDANFSREWGGGSI